MIILTSFSPEFKFYLTASGGGSGGDAESLPVAGGLTAPEEK